MKAILGLLVCSLAIVAQSLTPTAAPNVVAGKPITVNLTLTAGAQVPAALQWNFSASAGTLTAWTGVAAGKTLTCGAGTCVLVALNTTPIAAGTVATVVVTYPTSTRGNQTVTLSSNVAADAMGNGFAPPGGSATIAVLSPFDLNGDGKVDGADLQLAARQVVGLDPCGTADFNADGRCTVVDLILLIQDSMSATP